MMTLSEITNLLNKTEEAISNGNTFRLALSAFVRDLHKLKISMSAKDWRAFKRFECPEHSLHKLLQADPLTRSFNYNTDNYVANSILLDHFYGFAEIDAFLEQTSSIGRKIYHFLVSSPIGKVLRWRQQTFAKRIGQLVRKKEKPRILFAYCGHAQELLRFHAKKPDLGRLVFFDDDPFTLDILRRDFSGHDVEFIQASAGQDYVLEGSFDAIYSSNICDRFGDKQLKKVITQLSSLLNAEGSLFLSGFTPTFSYEAFIESFLNWRVRYRSIRQLSHLLQSSDLRVCELSQPGNKEGFVLECAKP
ncbi:MAG: class I SAM-dependent methyltransferase [Planctomycetota bacterium]|nr:class I SAM-dependent methyltransferase [Planctomycetota bacterium]